MVLVDADLARPAGEVRVSSLSGFGPSHLPQTSSLSHGIDAAAVLSLSRLVNGTNVEATLVGIGIGIGAGAGARAALAPGAALSPAVGAGLAGAATAVLEAARRAADAEGLAGA